MLEIRGWAPTEGEANDTPSPEVDWFSPYLDERQPMYRLSHHVRLLDLGGGGAMARKHWLRQVVPIEQSYSFKEDDWSYLAQADATFRLLLLSGPEADVLENQVRFVRKTLPSKIIVPLMSWGDRADIARLLRSGADDVLHMEMAIAEAELRLGNLLRQEKWRNTKDRRLATNNRKRQLASIVTRHGLSGTERDILEKLLDHSDHIVPYANLVGCPRVNSLKLRKGLAVSMHHLRSKLGKSWVIRNVRGQGYMLEREGSRRA